MKITEIKWEDGKKYKYKDFIYKVCDSDLYRKNYEGDYTKDIVDDFELMVLLTLDFEEVFEPVDFITAYKDCLENGTKYYGEKYNHDKIRKDINGKVFVYTLDKDSNPIWTEQNWIKED